MRRPIPPFPKPKRKRTMLILTDQQLLTETTLDGYAVSIYDFPLDPGQNAQVHITSFAREAATGDSFGAEYSYTIKTGAPDNIVVGFTALHEVKDPGASAWDLEAVGTGDGLSILVTGEDLKTIDWVVKSEIIRSEVGSSTPDAPEVPDTPDSP